LASNGLWRLLALEVSFARGPTPDRQRGARSHPKNFENPLWGATKIHGELLKLGIEVAQSTVSIYMMVPRRDRPLQTRKTFLQSYGGDCLD